MNNINIVKNAFLLESVLAIDVLYAQKNTFINF